MFASAVKRLRVQFYVSECSFMSPSAVLCLHRVKFYVSECSFMSPPSEVLCPSWLCLFPPSAELIKSGSKAEKDKVKRTFFTFRVSILSLFSVSEDLVLVLRFHIYIYVCT